MKNFITCLIFILTTDLFGACSSPIARDNFQQGDVVSSAKINQDFDDLYAHFNDFNGDCIDSFSIRETPIQDGAVTTEKIQDASITTEKFANGVIPVFSTFSRVRVFTANGTYVKPANIERILVQVVGGGGGVVNDATVSVKNGGASSFGSHCTAGGGGGSRVVGSPQIIGAGGISTGGDINLTGPIFFNNADLINGLLGDYGGGGGMNTAGGGLMGGGGAYCAKLIDKTTLADKTIVTIGKGGVWGNEYGPSSGKDGIVIIQEFTR